VADAILDALAGLPTVPTYLVLMLLSALENVFPPVPADVAVALGAFLAHRGQVSAPLLGILCWGANTASSAGVYFLARAYGVEFFATGWRRSLLPPEALDALHEAYARHGVGGIFFTRFLPGLRAAVTPFAGIAGLSPARALVPAAAASALWYAFLTLAGAAFGKNWEAVKGLVETANRALAIAAVGATLLLGAYLWRLIRARRGRP
jgi:membrane protein DedA with SNARE-associated domain